MNDETSWLSDPIEGTTWFDLSSEHNSYEGSKEASPEFPLLDFSLPDHLLEQIFARLPVASIVRASCVSKQWYKVVTSKTFLGHLSHLSPQKPWYYMFTNSDEPTGYAYDPMLRKWYNIELPFIEMPNWFIASSRGLVCFMDNDTRTKLCVCNPIAKSSKLLEEPAGMKLPDYSALAMSADTESNKYEVSVVKSKQVPGDFFQWDVSIHVYDSGTGKWATPLAEVLNGWRGGDESVICGGVLYFLIYASGGGGDGGNRHGVIKYDLSTGVSRGLLARCSVPVPCSLTCGRLMNLKERLVMVGGIGKRDRPGIIKGIGVWLLKGNEWEEVSRVPHKYFQGFGEIDDVFASSGTDDLLYIQSYGAPTLLVFDIKLKLWKWSQKCPVTKRFPLQLFSGFCFEPRLEIEP